MRSYCRGRENDREGEKMKFYDLMDEKEEGTFITFESRYEAEQWLKEKKENYPKYVAGNGIHIVENERLLLSEKHLIAIELLEKSVEEIENCYGKDTDLTLKIREFLNND